MLWDQKIKQEVVNKQNTHILCDVSVPILVHEFEQLLGLGLLPHELLVGHPPLGVQVLALQQLGRLVPDYNVVTNPRTMFVILRCPPDPRVKDHLGPLLPAQPAVPLAAEADRLLELSPDLLLLLVLLLFVVHQKPTHFDRSLFLSGLSVSTLSTRELFSVHITLYTAHVCIRRGQVTRPWVSSGD